MCISHSVSVEKNLLLMGSKLAHPSNPHCNQFKLPSEETVMQGTEFSHSHPGKQWYLSGVWIGWGWGGSCLLSFCLFIFTRKKLYSNSVYLPCLHPKHVWVRVCFLSRICCYKIYKWLCYFSVFSLCILISESEAIRTIRLKISATAVDFSPFKRCLKPHNRP